MNNLIFNETAKQLKTTIYGVNPSGDPVALSASADGILSVNVSNESITTNTQLITNASTLTYMLVTFNADEAATTKTITFDTSDKKLNTFFIYSSIPDGVTYVDASVIISPTTNESYYMQDPKTATISIDNANQNQTFVEAIYANFAGISLTNSAAFDADQTITLYYNGQV